MPAHGASFPLRHRPLNRALRALRSTPRTRRLRPKQAFIIAAWGLASFEAAPNLDANAQYRVICSPQF